MSKSLGTQSIWTFADYARVADWIGQFPNGVQMPAIQRHFSGCGDMTHRVSFMVREGIIQTIPIANGDKREIRQIRHKYIQVRKIPHKDKPLPRGQGYRALSHFSEPLERPSTMTADIPTPAVISVVGKKPEPVTTEGPANPAPQQVEVYYNAAKKSCVISTTNMSVVLQNVDLKLELK